MVWSIQNQINLWLYIIFRQAQKWSGINWIVTQSHWGVYEKLSLNGICKCPNDNTTIAVVDDILKFCENNCYLQSNALYDSNDSQFMCFFAMQYIMYRQLHDHGRLFVAREWLRSVYQSIDVLKLHNLLVYYYHIWEWNDRGCDKLCQPSTDQSIMSLRSSKLNNNSLTFFSEPRNWEWMPR